jgi:hypothetical protein
VFDLPFTVSLYGILPPKRRDSIPTTANRRRSAQGLI